MSVKVRTWLGDTGSGGSAVSRHGDMEKPWEDKDYACTETDPSQPLPVGGSTDIRLPSERTRTGIWYCMTAGYTSPEIWGDRKFAGDDRVHPNAKPQDGCRNPSVSRKQRVAMAIAEHNPGKLYGRNKAMLSMTHKQLHDFATKGPKKGKAPRMEVKGETD